jgi:hypothetical protein
MGQCTSVAVAGAVFALLGGTAAGGQLASGGSQGAEATFVNAFHWAFVVCAAIALLGVAAAAVRGREQDQAEDQPGQQRQAA